MFQAELLALKTQLEKSESEKAAYKKECAKLEDEVNILNTLRVSNMTRVTTLAPPVLCNSEWNLIEAGFNHDLVVLVILD